MELENIITLEHIVILLSKYLTHQDIYNISLTNKYYCINFINNNTLFKELCYYYNFKSLSTITRTRGIRDYKSIYISNLCIECNSNGNSFGMIIIDTDGGSYYKVNNKLVSLCTSCYQNIVTSNNNTMSLRVKNCLPKAKKKLEYITWYKLLERLPFSSNSKHKKKRTYNAVANNSSSCRGGNKKRDIDKADYNNHLLKQLGL